MTSNFATIPDVPPEIENAAQNGELVVFVGSGISVLVGCPTWDQFADKILQQLVPGAINYKELDQINKIKDPKKRLSIARIVALQKNVALDYQTPFTVSAGAESIYAHLNTFNSAFVTTNYDKQLAPLASASTPEKDWRVHKRDRLYASLLDQNGRVVHLHGCIDDPDNMVVTTKDYLAHYASEQVQVFLRELFLRKTVLFLGYGLEELEIIEYILRQGGAHERTTGFLRRFVLQGFLSSESTLADLLKSYYKDSFAIGLIEFSKDSKNYHQQIDIVAAWSRRLRFGEISLTDEYAALEDEIRG